MACAAGGENGSKVWAGIGNAIGDDDCFFGFEALDFGLIEGGEGDGKFGVAEGAAGEVLNPAGLGFQPIREACGVPVQNCVGEKWAAKDEDDPIADDGVFERRGRYVVEVASAVAKAMPEGMRAIFENEGDFCGAKFADVLNVGGELGVDVKDLHAELGIFGKAINH